MRKIKTKVIDLKVLLEKPTNRIMRFVMASNSIDSCILDLQEQYPNEHLTRKSVLYWKFMTNDEYKTLQEQMKNPLLLNSEQGVQECDASKVKTGN